MVDIDLDVVFLSLASHYVHVRALFEPALPAVVRVVYAGPRARALGQSPADRGVDYSWQMAAVKLGQSSWNKDVSFGGLLKISQRGLVVAIEMG